MPDARFDVAVLGGGTGGYTAAIRAAQLGKRAAVVEANKLGGCCLHVGCIPTKALLESSGLYHKVHERGEEYGILAREARFDYERIASRRDGVVNQLWKGVQGLMRKNRIEVFEGCGVLEGDGKLRVGDDLLQADAIIVATGSEPKSLPGIEFDGVRVVNSNDATLARELPRSVAIIGAGAVGVEFATFYRQMGSQVTLLEALDRLVPLEDEDVSRVLLQAFRKAGIDCRVGARVRGARTEGEGVVVELEDGEVQAEKLLVAVGRAPLSRGIGLEKAGGEFHTVFPRNAPIPNAKAIEATTSYDGQTDVAMRIYQGDNTHVAHNELLGDFLFSGLRPGPAGKARLEITFDVNVEGILTMSAKDLETGKQMKTTVRVTQH